MNTYNAGTLIVTGGGRGIGASIARLAARSGYSVCVNYFRNVVAAASVVDDILLEGGRTVAVQADVSCESDVLRLFRRASELLGPVCGLVNNAAVLEPQMRLEAMPAERMSRIFATNVMGTMLCSREAVRCMSTLRGGGGGSIVNLSSAASRYGSPGEYVDYAASKGAVDTFTLGLAREVAGEGIRVNAVRPGYVYTELHASGGEPGRVDRLKERVPMKRGAEPDEIARAVVWLLSAEASYVTGSILDVTGGL